MQNSLVFKTSYRVTFGVKKVHIGWINTDPSVELSTVSVITEDFSKHAEDLLLGSIDGFDDADCDAFHIASDEGFLGYMTTKSTSSPEVLSKIWPQLDFAVVVK